MEVAKFLLNIDNAQAEEFRRGTAKKDVQLVEENCNKLRDSTKLRGWTKEQTDNLIASFMAASNYSFNCIAGDQLIITDQGIKQFKDIVDNYNNYKVISLSGDGTLLYVTPIAAYDMGEKDLYEIELEDGSLIKCTPDHLLLSGGEWKTAQEIIDNDLELDIKNACEI